mmetsp:Transcript_24138/g.64760  ORF Transcript_24138/g.64760 Transcript_24138/m.64760 type:complete len:284 (+) Transcript_24138:342-1193(+)
MDRRTAHGLIRVTQCVLEPRRLLRKGRWLEPFERMHRCPPLGLVNTVDERCQERGRVRRERVGRELRQRFESLDSHQPVAVCQPDRRERLRVRLQLHSLELSQCLHCLALDEVVDVAREALQQSWPVSREVFRLQVAQHVDRMAANHPLWLHLEHAYHRRRVLGEGWRRQRTQQVECAYAHGGRIALDTLCDGGREALEYRALQLPEGAHGGIANRGRAHLACVVNLLQQQVGKAWKLHRRVRRRHKTVERAEPVRVSGRVPQRLTERESLRAHGPHRLQAPR